MPRYNIRNRQTNEYRYRVQAESTSAACESQGWLIGDCYIEEEYPPQEGKQPFVPTEDERELIQRYIDLEGVGLLIPEMLVLCAVLRRWLDAQD